MYYCSEFLYLYQKIQKKNNMNPENDDDDDDGDDFDLGHLSQNFYDSEVEQELTDIGRGNA